MGRSTATADRKCLDRKQFRSSHRKCYGNGRNSFNLWVESIAFAYAYVTLEYQRRFSNGAGDDFFRLNSSCSWDNCDEAPKRVPSPFQERP